MIRPLRRALTEPLRIAALATVSVWSTCVSTSRRKARRLAGSREAEQARHGAETRLRAIATAYDEETPLTLRLLVLEDHYVPGTPTREWLAPSKPSFKVSCWMRLTAYYSTDTTVAEAIDSILIAGERPLARIPFTHNNTSTPLLTAAEMSHAGHTLIWDILGRPVNEPERPPFAYRYVREPASSTVGEIRQRYGTVLALTLPREDYYRMSR